jgi:hypothetical protein
MRRLGHTLAVIAAASFVAVGCSDVGDSSAVGGDAQSPLEDASEDVTVQGSGEGGGPDGTIPVVDSGVDSTVPPNDEDSGAGDSAPPPDSASPDTGTIDAGQDSAPPDAGEDSGQGIDSGSMDSGTDAEGVDAGTDSGGADAEADATPALAPCTLASQTDCVQCNNGSADSLCTPTEAAIVARDIAKGYATGPGVPSNGCYACLESASALDDSTDTNQECSDTTNPTECLATLNCILASECALDAVNVCYCGTAPVSTTCNQDGTGAANGVCDTVIAAGFGVPVTSGHTILSEFTVRTTPSGGADAIFQRAISNTCTQCQQ